MNLEEKQIESKYIFNGKVINLREDTALLPNGRTATREVVEHNGGVCVAALDENRNVYLVEQYRYPYSENLLEVPAGKRNSKSEEPSLCGRRELKEETGLTAQKYYFLGKLYPTPGYCDEIIWLYAATGLSSGSQKLDDDEFLCVKKMPLDEAVSMVLDGRLTDAKTQVSLLKLKILCDKGEIEY